MNSRFLQFTIAFLRYGKIDSYTLKAKQANREQSYVQGVLWFTCETHVLNPGSREIETFFKNQMSKDVYFGLIFKATYQGLTKN